MKKQLVLAAICCALAALSFSCSTDVDLLADGDGAPIVYALLDSDADTNYVKITHTMGSGDAYVNANNPELSNYPGKLDVRLTEYRNGDSIRQIILDTITIHDKDEGVFYSPAQKLYYTAERLGKNTSRSQYSYRLTVVLPDRTITSDALMVGSDVFRIQTSVADFTGGYNKSPQEIWIAPAMNAGIYDVYMSFTFLERRTFTSDSIPRTASWHIGTYYQFELANHMHNDAFVVYYHPKDLYSTLEELLGDDTLVPGLRRYIIDDPIQVTVSAGGPNLTEYIYYLDVNSNTFNDDNTISHIDGGYGVFSSRMTTTRTMRLGGTTVPELTEKTKWGFKYIGGHL